jgi:hypothetical protein
MEKRTDGKTNNHEKRTNNLKSEDDIPSVPILPCPVFQYVTLDGAFDQRKRLRAFGNETSSIFSLFDGCSLFFLYDLREKQQSAFSFHPADQFLPDLPCYSSILFLSKVEHPHSLASHRYFRLGNLEQLHL